jgi:chromosome segregation ATPase
MTRETIIIIIFAACVVFAINLLVSKLNELVEQISALRERVEMNRDSILNQSEVFKAMRNDILGTEQRIDAAGHILEIMNGELKTVSNILSGVNSELNSIADKIAFSYSKLDNIDDYIKMMDDTVISTIRDEYKILEEIKQKFLSNEAEEEENECEEVKPN